MNISRIIACTLLFSILQTVVTAQQTYQPDPKNSKILWNSGRLGNHTGYLLLQSGTLFYSVAGQPVNGTFIINTAGIRSTDRASDSDRKKNEATLTSEDFLDAARYPVATMQVTKITRLNQTDSFNVSGQLTIKNITQPISFTAVITQVNKNLKITGGLDIHRYLWNIHRPRNQSTGFLTGLIDKAANDEAGISLDLLLVPGPLKP